MTTFELRPVPAALAERYLAEGAWDDRTLGEFLRDCLLQDPTRPFRIWSPTNPYLGTVGEVYEESLRVAGGLRALGLGPGDMVAFQLPNWVEAAITFYACSMLGVTLVPIVHFYGPKELGFILRQSGAKAIIIVSRLGQRDYLADLATVRDGLENLEHVVVVGDVTDGTSGYVRFDDLRSADPVSGPAHVDPDGPALIGYTSGTTADPKGVVHTHRTLGCEVRQLSDHQSKRDLPSLVGAPVGHAIGMLGGLLCPLYSKRPIYMIDGWDPPTVLDAMVEEHIAAGSGSTYFFTSLLDSPGFGPQHVELMRYVGLGGSPIPNAVAERADALGISLVRSYGSTEHPSITGSLHDAPKEKRIHTDGRPMAWVEIRTVDEEGTDVGVGEPGEILSRGADRFAGYTDPALNAEFIDADGWFSTGDIGVIDEDGYLTITDRVKDIIIRGGENISAREVEEVLARHPAVAEVAVCSDPDEVWGEAVCAVVVSRDGAGDPTIDELVALTDAAGLAPHKRPTRVVHTDALPRTAAGKVRKRDLRPLLEAGSTDPSG